MEMTFDTGSDAMLRLINKLIDYGDTCEPRGLLCYELNNVQIQIRRPWQIPLDVPGRNLNQFIGAVEAAQLVGQISVPELVTDRVKAFNRFTDRGVFHGAYGARVSGRLDDLVNVLRNDRDSRQAVLTIYDSAVDLDAKKRDIPCTIAIQFMLRRNELLMRVMMRSNDIWLGFPYDIVQFAALQAAIAADLDVPMGTYTHSVGSLHLYDNDRETADEIRDALPQQEARDYEPLWNGDIQMSSSRARRMLLGQEIRNPTTFETWLGETLKPRPAVVS